MGMYRPTYFSGYGQPTQWIRGSFGAPVPWGVPTSSQQGVSYGGGYTRPTSPFGSQMGASIQQMTGGGGYVAGRLPEVSAEIAAAIQSQGQQRPLPTSDAYIYDDFISDVAPSPRPQQSYSYLTGGASIGPFATLAAMTRPVSPAATLQKSPFANITQQSQLLVEGGRQQQQAVTRQIQPALQRISAPLSVPSGYAYDAYKAATFAPQPVSAAESKFGAPWKQVALEALTFGRAVTPAFNRADLEKQYDTYLRQQNDYRAQAGLVPSDVLELYDKEGAGVFRGSRQEYVDFVYREQPKLGETTKTAAIYAIPAYGTHELAQERGWGSGWTLASLGGDILTVGVVSSAAGAAARVGIAARSATMVAETPISIAAKTQALNIARNVGVFGMEAAGIPLRVGSGVVKGIPAAIRHPVLTAKMTGRAVAGSARLATYPLTAPREFASGLGYVLSGKTKLPSGFLIGGMAQTMSPIARVSVPMVTEGKKATTTVLKVGNVPLASVGPGGVRFGLPSSLGAVTASDIARGYKPVTAVETKVMTRSRMLSNLGVSEAEVSKLSPMIGEARAVHWYRSPYAGGPIPLEATKSLSANSVGVVYDEFAAFAKQNKDANAILYGSAGIKPQIASTRPELAALIEAGDLDLQFGLPQSKVESFVKTLVPKLQATENAAGTGRKIRIHPQNPTLIESKLPGGSWVHAVDIHAYPSGGVAAASGAYGIKFAEPTVTSRTPSGQKIRLMSTAEMEKRLTTGSLLGWQSGEFLPEAHRTKDIERAIILAEARGNSQYARFLAEKYGVDYDDVLRGFRSGSHPDVEAALGVRSAYSVPTTEGSPIAAASLSMASSAISPLYSFRAPSISSPYRSSPYALVSPPSVYSPSPYSYSLPSPYGYYGSPSPSYGYGYGYGYSLPSATPSVSYLPYSPPYYSPPVYEPPPPVWDFDAEVSPVGGYATGRGYEGRSPLSRWIAPGMRITAPHPFYRKVSSGVWGSFKRKYGAVATKPKARRIGIITVKSTNGSAYAGRAYKQATAG